MTGDPRGRTEKLETEVRRSQREMEENTSPSSGGGGGFDEIKGPSFSVIQNLRVRIYCMYTVYRYISLGWPRFMPDGQLFSRNVAATEKRKTPPAVRGRRADPPAHSFTAPRVNYVRLIESTTDDLCRTVLPLFPSGLSVPNHPYKPFCSCRRQPSFCPASRTSSEIPFRRSFLKNRFGAFRYWISPAIELIVKEPDAHMISVRRMRFLFKTP